MAHTDAQVEKILDYLVDQDAFDNTLVIYLTGDTGASAEGTVHGAWSAPSFRMVCTKIPNGCSNTWTISALTAAKTISTSGGPGLWIRHFSG